MLVCQMPPITSTQAAPSSIRRPAPADAQEKAPKLQVAELLIEQRKVGDTFRAHEKIIQKMHSLLARSKVDTVARARIEADLTESTADLLRIGQRMLELDTALARLLRR